MSEVRAFVGHSFTEDDKHVVETFLGLFRTLQDSSINFSWDHAKKAEANELAAKVLAKIEGKNTFIGICTRKYQIIKTQRIRKIWPFKRIMVFEEQELEWKTSDWIMQEIGLAVGRGLKLILFVEDEVQYPSGLQGATEYIPFSREKPQESFLKFIEMINSLNPAPALGMATASEKEIQYPEKSENLASDASFRCEPNWDRVNYEYAMMRAILKGQETNITDIDIGFKNSIWAKSREDIAAWDALCEYWKIFHGKNGKFYCLKQIADENPDNSEVIEFLAHAYSRYKDFVQAARVYKQAASLSKTEDQAIQNLKSAALSLQASGDASAVSEMADQIRGKFVGLPDSELKCLKALREIYEQDKNNILDICLMERLLEVDPGDNETRFAAAYKHSDCGNTDLSLFHYLTIPQQERSAIAWNNLGVAYSEFKLATSAVEAFSKAKDMNETLAMSNLAHRYMGAGFLNEARAECEVARKIPEYNSNINAALTRIEEIPIEEVKKEKEILESGQRKRTFMRQFGGALCTPHNLPITGVWAHPKCAELSVRQSGRQFHAVGSYENQGNALLAASLLGQTFSGSSRQVTLTYEGIIRGRALECTIKVDDGDIRGAGTSILSDFDEPKRVLMFLSDDGSEMHAMENPFSRTPTFFSISR